MNETDPELSSNIKHTPTHLTTFCSRHFSQISSVSVQTVFTLHHDGMRHDMHIRVPVNITNIWLLIQVIAASIKKPPLSLDISAPHQINRMLLTFQIEI